MYFDFAVMNLNEELFRVIKAGDKHRVKELIQLGADVDFLYGMQGTPLCGAISANQLDITRFQSCHLLLSK